MNANTNRASKSGQWPVVSGQNNSTLHTPLSALNVLLFSFFFILSPLYAQLTPNLTAPITYEVYNHDFPVEVSVSPTGASGTVSKVEIILNRGEPLELVAPYNHLLADLTPASYHLQAVVHDDTGSATEEAWFVVMPEPYEDLPAARPANGKLKIFIVSGQSNMVGYGQLLGSDPGTFEYHLENQPDLYGHLVDSQGEYTIRDDVWYIDKSYEQDGGHKQGWLTVGYGTSTEHIGPEYAFGYIMGDYYEDPVLIIKSAWGGRSLSANFLSPSSADYAVPQADGDTGFQYQEVLRHVEEITADFDSYVPNFTGTEYEIVGFGWHQGWNDRINADAVNAYESNMVNFIKDMRDDLGVEDLPFVVANTGMGGWDIVGSYKERVENHMQFQLDAVDPAKHPEFEGNAVGIETRDFWRHRELSPSGQDFHWWRNWETYYIIGESMAREMIPLIPGGTTPVEENGGSASDIGSNSITVTTGALEFQLQSEGPYTLSIFNLADGSVIKQVSAHGLKGSNRLYLEKESLPQGVYYFRLDSGGQIWGQKVSLLW